MTAWGSDCSRTGIVFGNVSWNCCTTVPQNGLEGWHVTAATENVLAEDWLLRLSQLKRSLWRAAWDPARALSTALCQVLLANTSHARVGRAALYSRLPQPVCTDSTYLTPRFQAQSRCCQMSCFPSSPRCVEIWQVSGGQHKAE